MKKEKANEETVGLKMADKNADKDNDLAEGYSVVVVDGSAGDSSFIDTTEDKFHTKDEPYSGKCLFASICYVKWMIPDVSLKCSSSFF